MTGPLTQAEHHIMKSKKKTISQTEGYLMTRKEKHQSAIIEELNCQTTALGLNADTATLVLKCLKKNTKL